MRRRTTIIIDDALLREAQAVLGTSGLKDTVDNALHQVISASRRRRLAALIRTGEAFDFEHERIDRDRQWRTSHSS